MWQYNHSDELYHYGVLGMKWGKRKAAKYSSKISNAKKTGKEDIKEWKEIGKIQNKNVSKNIAKSKAITNKQISKNQKKLDGMQTVTKKTQERVDAMSTGKKMGQSLLLGSYGSLVYNSVKAKGASTGKAVTQAVVNNWANNVTFGKLSRSSTW